MPFSVDLKQFHSLDISVVYFREMTFLHHGDNRYQEVKLQSVKFLGHLLLKSKQILGHSNEYIGIARYSFEELKCAARSLVLLRALLNTPLLGPMGAYGIGVRHA